MTKSVFTDAYQTLLELLVKTRNEAGVKQTELAQRLDWDQTKISNVERGIRRLDVIEFVAFARALEIDAEELFSTLLERLPDQIEI